MTSIHLYNATKKDIENIYNLLVEYKETDLANANYPAIDKNKLLNFINTIYVKGRIILISDLDTDELIGCCMFNVSEYFFSTQKIMTIQMIYIKKKYRNFKLVKQIVKSVKELAEDMPIVLQLSILSNGISLSE